VVSGGYDAITAPVFGGAHAGRLLLEYDDQRSGTFDPLRLVPGGKVVVLGLVTTKTSRRAAGPDQGPARPGTLGHRC
jgi:5-methyltetrahydropteroyltriglutamate--homocysteine methyltransferase